MGGFSKGPFGFQINLENGWTVSVQFGIGSYCSNRSNTGNPFTDIPEFVECDNAEIAAWPTDDRRGNWYTFEDGEQVKGWQNPTKVIAFINLIARKPGYKPNVFPNPIYTMVQDEIKERENLDA